MKKTILFNGQKGNGGIISFFFRSIVNLIVLLSYPMTPFQSTIKVHDDDDDCVQGVHLTKLILQLFLVIY